MSAASDIPTDDQSPAFHDPELRWLSSVRDGFTWIIAGNIINLLLGLSWLVLWVLQFTPLRPSFHSVYLANSCASLLPQAILVWAVFRVTRSSPHLPGGIGLLGIATRLLFVTNLGCHLWTPMVLFMQMADVHQPFLSAYKSGIVAIAAMLCLIAYAGRLITPRNPSAGRLVVQLLGGLILISLLGLTVYYLFPPWLGPRSGSAAPTTLLSLLTLALGLVWFAGLILFLVKCRSTFSAAISTQPPTAA